MCSNHQSYLDGSIIETSIPFKGRMNLFFIGYRYYFEMPVLRILVKLFRIIPIDTTSNVVSALLSSKYVLKNEKSLCVFPEGARTPDGKLQVFKKGIGILAKDTLVPIVPVYIKGSYEAWPVVKKYPKPHPITIRYGKPVKTDEMLEKGYQLGAKDDYGAIAIGLHNEVDRLSKM